MTSNDVSELLKRSAVQFVVADVGSKLKWIDKDQCFDFWKTEAALHIANDVLKIHLDDFSDNYAYIASHWMGNTTAPIVLLEKIH